MAERESLRAVFDDVADVYDRIRPTYPPELFQDLATVVTINQGSRLLEIGCGTGQATLPLAEFGCHVSAVDLGANMVRIARRKLDRFRRVEVHHATFEDWPLPEQAFDVVFCATAFHWIDPATRYVKSAGALRTGGILATISTTHVRGGSRRFFEASRSCYHRYGPPQLRHLRLPTAAEVQRHDGQDKYAEEFFDRVLTRTYERDVCYTADEYLDLLSTYSDHRALPRRDRVRLLSCISRLLEQEPSGSVTKRYLFELMLRRRR